MGRVPDQIEFVRTKHSSGSGENHSNLTLRRSKFNFQRKESKRVLPDGEVSRFVHTPSRESEVES
jgi:hypothetical protein